MTGGIVACCRTVCVVLFPLAFLPDFQGLMLLLISCGLLYLVFTVAVLSFRSQILGLELREWKAIQAKILRRSE